MTPRAPVVHNYDFCDLPPRPIQTPILGSIDIEDITDLILGERPEDRTDDRVNYVFEFEGTPLEMPERPEGFLENATSYCQRALLVTQAAELCQRLNFDTTEFVNNCINDMMFQANNSAFVPGTETDGQHGLFALAQLEAMQSACVTDAIRRRQNIQLTCEAGSDCNVTCVEEPGLLECVPTCIGDCHITFNNTNLANLIDLQCPNDCGANLRINDTVPGQCVQVNGTNQCQCQTGFTGVDCSIQEGEPPIAISLFPFTCDLSQESCPDVIDVTGEEFYSTDALACAITDDDVVHRTNATYVSSTILRCPMPRITHTGASSKLVQVRVSMDGSTFSEPLAYTFADARCRVCNRSGLCNQRVANTCIIDDECYLADQLNPENPDCQVCSPSNHTFDWTFNYTAPQCGPTLSRLSTSVNVPENHPVGSPITVPGETGAFELRANPYTDDDVYTPVQWSISGPDASIFSINSEGALRLLSALDFETRSVYNITVMASKGGLSDQMDVTITVTNLDERLIWDLSSYTATIVENQFNDALITVHGTDPDGENTPFGDITYTLSVMAHDPSALQHFAIDPETGVVRITDPLNYEDMDERNFRVVATSAAGSTSTTAVRVNVVNANEAPTAVRLLELGYNRPAMTLTEGMARGDIVGRLVVDDPDHNDRHTLALVNDSNGRFSLNSQNQLVVEQGGFDYESLVASGNLFYTVIVRATDLQGETHRQELLLTITDGNDAPYGVQIYQYDPATLGATPDLLAEIPEDQPLGVVGIVTVQDQDAEQTHVFTLEGVGPYSSDSDGPPFRIYGNELRLIRPLNYEDTSSYSISIYAIDNGQPIPLQSASQQFTIDVLDRPDLPGYFSFTPASGAGISESTAVGTTIGSVTGLDQDANQAFIISLSGSASVSVGNTTCGADSNGYTNCSAPVTLVEPVDFESNRVSASAAVMRVDVQAADSSEGTLGTGSLFIQILDAPDAPTGVLVESLLPGGGDPAVVAQVEVEEAQMTLPRVARLHAFDPDDSCPVDVEGCMSYEPTGRYTFALAAPNAVYELSAACSELKSVAARDTSSSHCEIVLRDDNGAVQVGQPVETLQIIVTDQSNLAITTVLSVTVIPPQVRAALSFETVAESVVESSGIVNTAGNIGTLEISGWTEAESPLVTLTGTTEELFAIAASRRRDAPRTIVFSVSVKPGAVIDYETTPTIVFTLSVGPAGTFAGEDFAIPLEVTDEDEPWRTVVCVDNSCLPAAEHNIRLHDDTGRSAIASLEFSDPDSSIVPENLFWSIVSTVPQTNLFTMSNGELGIRASPNSLNLDNGPITVTIAVADPSAPVSAPRTDRISVTVNVYDDCENHTCAATGTCRDQVNRYTCQCQELWTGPDCSTQIVLAADAIAGAGGESDSGLIIGIVIGVILLLLLVIGVALFWRNKRMNDQMVLKGLGAVPNPTYMPSVAQPDAAVYESVDNSMLVHGVANPMYAWYRPKATKQSVYQELSTAVPGTFVVRDALSSVSNPMYCLHVKTPKALIKDVTIDGAPKNITIINQRGAPKFDTLPDLVDYYSRPTDQDFVLSSGAVTAISTMEVYDNALIKNKRVEASGPAVPLKQTSY